jgi:hypothetical protein
MALPWRRRRLRQWTYMWNDECALAPLPYPSSSHTSLVEPDAFVRSHGKKDERPRHRGAPSPPPSAPAVVGSSVLPQHATQSLKRAEQQQRQSRKWLTNDPRIGATALKKRLEKSPSLFGKRLQINMFLSTCSMSRKEGSAFLQS